MSGRGTMRNKRLKILLWSGLVLFTAIFALWLVGQSASDAPLASGRLADGRVLQIEKTTFGRHHRLGGKSLIVEYFGPWLPNGLRDALSPKYPSAEINLESPALVVWVNAIDPATGRHVDCQGIRVEFVNEHGERFGSENSHWFGGNTFWRVGYVFDAFPRSERRLTFQIVPWRSNQPSRVQFANPHVTKPAQWSGKPPPQQKHVRGLDILLTGLKPRTSGGPVAYWHTESRYWEPVFSLQRNGALASGWDEPQWIAQDPTGNRGKYLGAHQPVLRFSPTFYPSATNLKATIRVGALPSTAVTNVLSNVWWNAAYRFEGIDILALGLFPTGTHHFSRGMYQSNPPVAMRMTTVKGGAPSGWMGRSMRSSPLKVERWYGHYTPTPVIYLRAKSLDSNKRLAVRLRDDQGRHWAAKPEPQGTPEDIRPFLVELPSEVRTVVPEIVVLDPVIANFDVTIPAAGHEPDGPKGKDKAVDR
jgi:hypothetical protein